MGNTVWRAILLLALATPAAADTISLPATSFERSGSVVATYHSDQPEAGVLTLDWTDALGRLVDHQRIQIKATPDTSFDLDLRRALTLQNNLSTLFTSENHRRESAHASFIARPPADAWDSYQILMWQDQTPAAYQGLRRLGVSGAMLYAKSGEIRPAALADRLSGGMPFYLENLATDFYAPYHMASSTALFDAAQKRHIADPSDIGSFIREPSLSDPIWQDRIRSRLAQTVAAMSKYRPLFYNIGDETGIADLAAAWDFDLSPASLAAMRIWLSDQYGTLDALNTQWGTSFATWADVTPMLTSDALKRSDDNFSAWADFKAWMDAAFVRAVRGGTDALHEADPTARSAIEGAQVPGWGGYDYGLLANATDLMEIYDEGSAVEIARNINPNLIVITTSFAGDDNELHRLWHEILMGTRGHVLWDEDHGFVSGAGVPAEQGRKIGSAYPELRGGVPAQLIASKERHDPVAILYSQASFRTAWLLDRRAESSPWYARRAETEFAQDNDWRKAMRRTTNALVHIGIQPQIVASEHLEKDGLPNGTKVLILPYTIALSSKEVGAIKVFSAQGGTVVAEGEPGRFDHHSRRLTSPALADLPRMIRNPVALQTDKLDSNNLADLSDLLRSASVIPAFHLTRPFEAVATGVTIRSFRNGATTILGIQQDSRADKSPEGLVLHLNAPAEVTDLRRHEAMGATDTVGLTLNPTLPTLLALSQTKPSSVTLTGPGHAKPGDIIEFHLALDVWSAAEHRIVQAELTDPSGEPVPSQSRNITLSEGKAVWTVPLALNDSPGVWAINILDVLSGKSISRKLVVSDNASTQ